MSDSNNPADILAQSDPNSTLVRRLRELENENANLRQAGSTVVAAPFAVDAPRYKLNEPGFYSDMYFDVGSELTWTGTPNLTMVPVNQAAERAMQDFIEYLSECQRKRDEQAGREFTGLVSDRGVLQARSMHDARIGRAPDVVMPVEKVDVPVMPHTDAARAQAEIKRRGRPPSKEGRVLDAKLPEAPRPRPEQTGNSVSGNGPTIFADGRNRMAG